MASIKCQESCPCHGIQMENVVHVDKLESSAFQCSEAYGTWNNVSPLRHKGLSLTNPAGRSDPEARAGGSAGGNRGVEAPRTYRRHLRWPLGQCPSVDVVKLPSRAAAHVAAHDQALPTSPP
jgi:hypothetical protein